jgi:hypothetical protein
LRVLAIETSMAVETWFPRGRRGADLRTAGLGPPYQEKWKPGFHMRGE